MLTPIDFDTGLNPNIIPQARMILERQVQTIQEKLPDLPLSFIQENIFLASKDWEQNTGLTLEKLTQNQTPLFQLVHFKLIFALFTERIHCQLKKQSQQQALDQIRESFCEQFENLCRNLE